MYGRIYAQQRDMMQRGGELYVLTLFALLGQMVMISAGNLISIYLGLELMSLALYALIALRREDKVATEAAMKYFVLGALASGFLLYGMSMVYGATGHLDLAKIAEVIASGQAKQLPLVFGVVFLVSGLAFKLGAVPFHMWLPDVYQGSPTAVTLILGAALQAGGLRHHAAPAGRRPARAGGRLAADAHDPGRAVAGDRQPDRHRPDQLQAHAGLFDHLAHRLRAAGPDGRRGRRQARRGGLPPMARPCSTC